MEGVLEAATAWSACKLASSLLVLPWLPASCNAVSFCCCCLLVFSDVAVTGFLAFLCFSKSWPTELSLPGDILAFRFLLFLSHVYGAAVLLSCPLITLEALSRLRRPRVAPSQADGGRACVGQAAEETEDGGARPDGEKRHSHGASFLCCLIVWVAVLLHVRWRWMLEEVHATACLLTTNSPLTCLPRLTSSMSSCAGLYVVVTFFLLLLLLLKLDLRTGHQASAELAETHMLNQNRLRGLIPAWGLPRTLASPCVDPEKTVSSCVAPRSPAISSREPFPTGQKQERTKSSKPLTFAAEAQEERVWCRRAFPCLGVDVIMGLMGVLCIFVLPLILSINIVFIQTVDHLTEQAVRALVAAPEADKSDLPTSHEATGSRSQQGSSFAQAGSNVDIC
ncbi:uncharacterized protein LOC130523999 isoform X1 [Takifugu flavidus]|uniref:Uncharacterized protein n=1 Tax=Takifugu flavidus TaxID=433684 RepID=A0A5C6N4X0_9TELE|nr:uncharacterized protein LOC130523999 isoform X1 [Takifugu flavidus]TWW61959.1 hypothetical protein D4764_04G0006060 [Takifugu flavidus]